MRKKKLLFMEDLLQFFKENNLTKFSSSDSGYKLCVQVPATFEVEDEVDDDHRGMMRLKFRVFHLDENRNGSFVSKKAAKAAMPTIKNRPVMAYIHQRDDGEWDFESHNITVETDENGNNYLEFQEKQVGSFDESEPFFEYDETFDKTYVCAYAYISEDYTRACDIIRRKGGTKNSVELSIEELAYNSREGYLELQKFYVSASTLLGSYDDGTEVGEGMLGSRADIADFSEKNNSVLSDRQELINEVTNAVIKQLSDIKAFAENSKEGGKPKEMGKFNELLAKYNKTIEDITFEYENMSDEELEVAFADAFETAENLEDSSSEGNVVEEETPVVETESSDDASTEATEKTTETVEGFADGDTSGDNDVTDDVTDDSTNDTHEETNTEDVDNTDDGVLNNGQQGKRTYSINGMSFEVSISQIQQAITELINDQYSESDNDYYFVEIYQDSKTVVMSGMFSGRSYRQGYKVRNDVYSLVGSRVPVKPVFVTADEEAELDRMRSNYSSIEEKLRKYESEPEKMDILNSSDYANIADQANFNELKKQENHFDLTVDEVKEKADAMLLQYAKSGKLNFAVNEQPKDEPKKDFFAFARVEHNTSFLDGLLKNRM